MGSTFIHTEFEKKNLKSLVTSAGGKNLPDQMERIFLFKNELLTRNRVVTKEDIRVLCFSELGNALKEVNITPGAMVIQGSDSGLQNCIHVKLKFSNGVNTSEKEGLIKYVKKSLQLKSSCIYRYKVESVE
jgi:hypothetical protein